MGKPNYKQIFARQNNDKKRILAVNNEVDESSGIYILYRTDELHEKHCYVGQAVHLLTRLASHLSGYQYIDNSIKAHGLYSEKNPFGYKIGIMHYPIPKLDEMEMYWIEKYRNNGYIMKNLTSGSQGVGKTKIAEYKPPRTYTEGKLEGKKQLAKDLSNIIDKHLIVAIKPEKSNNKISQRQLDKFWELLSEETYKE